MEKDNEKILWLLNDSGLSIERISEEAFISTYFLNKIKTEGPWLRNLPNDKATRLNKLASDLKNKKEEFE